MQTHPFTAGCFGCRTGQHPTIGPLPPIPATPESHQGYVWQRACPLCALTLTKANPMTPWRCPRCGWK